VNAVVGLLITFKTVETETQGYANRQLEHAGRPAAFG